MKAKSPRGELTRQRILHAAARLIQKKGVNGTSIDDVLEASQTGKSQFYHYFCSKETLILELISEYGNGLNGGSRGRLLEKLDPHGLNLDCKENLQVIHHWLDQILEDFRSGLYADGCPIGNLASELSSQNEDLRTILQSTFVEWESNLALFFKNLLVQKPISEKSTDSFDPLGMAMFYIASIEGALLLAKTQRCETPLKATLDHLKSHLQTLNIKRSPMPFRRTFKRLSLSFAP